MIKNFLLLFLIFIFSINLYADQDQTNDVEKSIEGIIIKKATSWHYSLKYDEKIISCVIKQILNKYIITIQMDDETYNGKIWTIEGFFLPDFYELVFDINDLKLESEIKIKRRDFKKYFRTDNFEIYINRKKYEWRIQESSKKKTYDIFLGEKQIYGEEILKGKKSSYDFDYVNGYIKGEHIKKRKEDTLVLQIKNITKNELIIFLILNMYNKYIIENEKDSE